MGTVVENPQGWSIPGRVPELSQVFMASPSKMYTFFYTHDQADEDAIVVDEGTTLGVVEARASEDEDEGPYQLLAKRPWRAVLGVPEPAQ